MKDVVEATGQRQATISQHLVLMRRRGILRAERAGAEMHRSLADARILDACRITRELLVEQLTRQGALAGMRTA